jgi:exonuclease-1
MGITGLLPKLASITTNIHIQELAGMTVAIDAYVWLHRGAYACSSELCKNIPTDK